MRERRNRHRGLEVWLSGHQWDCLSRPRLESNPKSRGQVSSELRLGLGQRPYSSEH